ncbi:MAG: toprim domain-containing protein, partial [Anaerolineae bacterium]|nr:toprim domain-containing protein [Anaerolineae bacterium]
VIGFGARTLDPHGVPKYLNSPQTELFDKSRTLFGLSAARKSIRRQDQAVIVEGYMDVMQAHQAGFKNVVAEMGTALTEHQIRQLQRMTKRITLALDPDTAGVQATLRGVQVASAALEKAVEPVFDPRGLVGYAERLDAEIRIIQLPAGQDPDDLIRDAPERWTELVQQAQPVVEFYMDKLLTSANLDDAHQKKSVVDAMIPLLRDVGNPVERSSYAQRLVRALNISAPQFLHELERQTRQAARRSGRDDGSTVSEMLISPRSDLERYCITALLRRASALGYVNQALSIEGLHPLGAQDFQDAGWRTIFESWQTLVAGEGQPSIQELHSAIPVDLYPQLNNIQLDDISETKEEDLLRDITRTVLRLREPALAQRIQELYTLILDAQEAGGDEIGRYTASLRSYTAALRHVQKALSET